MSETMTHTQLLRGNIVCYKILEGKHWPILRNKEYKL